MASKIQKAGFNRYSREQVSIVDRQKLAAITCECHKIVQDKYNRLLGDSTASEILLNTVQFH